MMFHPSTSATKSHGLPTRVVLAVLFSIAISSTVIPLAVQATPSDARTSVDKVETETGSEPTAEMALEAKADAVSLHEELQTLDAREEVTVDEQLFTSIRYHLERGNLAFQAEEYGTAIQHYEKAANQARAGLLRGYQSGAETLLDASESQVTVLKEAGYTDPEVTMLETRIQETRKQLASVDDLQAARSSYESAREIHDDVQDLPHPRTVGFVNVLVSGWPLLVGGLVAMCIAGLWFWRSRDSETNVSVH